MIILRGTATAVKYDQLQSPAYPRQEDPAGWHETAWSRLSIRHYKKVQKNLQ